MMKNKFTKRIFLGLLIVSLGLLLIVPISAFAVDQVADGDLPKETIDDDTKGTKAPESKCEEKPLDKKYTFAVKVISDSEGEVTGFDVISYKNNNVTNTDLKFKLYQIGDYTLPTPYEFTPGTESKPHTLKLHNFPEVKKYFKEIADGETPDDGNRFYTYFHFESMKGTNASESKCNIGVKFKIKTSVGELGPEMEEISYGSDIPVATVRKGHAIDKTTRPTDAFDQLIYDAYQAAIGSQTFTSGTAYYTKDSGSSAIWHIPDADKITLQCDFTQKFKPSEIKYANYYKNTKYMYGTNEFSIQGGDYVYHPLNDDTAVHVPGGTCKVKCEEGVKVEYGPPVASKAGLCFEYKVRVTSHVNCYATADPPEIIKSVYKVCTPTPECVHASGYTLDRAGPNEEFAACVNECDGGKYTLKCSKKCYKKVYGKSNNNISDDFYNDYVEAIGHTSDCTDPYGCYYFDSNNKLQWAGRTASNKHTLTDVYKDDKFGNEYFGRYYTNGRNKDKGGSGKLAFIFNSKSTEVEGRSYYINDGDGFARKIYSTTSWCNANCSWKGCGTPVTKKDGKVVSVNYYLNGGKDNEQMKKDNELNVKTYNALVDQCSAAAKCSTQHAEFQITVDYKTGESTKTISFPYDENNPSATSATNPDKLCSNNGQETEGCSSTFDSAKSTIIYDAGATKPADNTPKSAKEMHYYENPAGCYDSANKSSSTTDDTQNRTYRGTITFPGAWINYKTGEITFKPVTDPTHWEHIEDKFCIPREAKDVNTKYWLYYQDGKVCEKEVNSINASDIQSWNIKAYIKDFGLYNWNINVECFYALDETDNTCDRPTDSNTAYRIRSVDLNDLFPDTEGQSRNATSDTGRDPGFNWTEYAVVDESKNAYYQSNPTTLINTIQGVNYGIYSKKYLDYEFNLDTNTLREMRREINDKNYTDFDEDGFQKSTVAGIGYYYSEKIRNLGNKNKTPDKAIIDLVCNNLQLDESGNYLENCGVTNKDGE